jgi:hypothetical protein
MNSRSATAPRTVTRAATLPSAPAAIFALLGLTDVALLGVVGSSFAPPLAVSIVVAALGFITLAAIVPARNGSRPALITVVAARVISAILAVGAFIATAPVWIMAIEALVIAATLIALLLLRRTPPSPRSPAA